MCYCEVICDLIYFLVMGDSFKPKVSGSGTDAKDPILNKAAIDFMKIIEQKNRERVEKLRLTARRNRIVGLSIGAGVFSIYLYSIFAVQQETFLDDFNEPKKVQQ